MEATLLTSSSPLLLTLTKTLRSSSPSSSSLLRSLSSRSSPISSSLTRILLTRKLISLTSLPPRSFSLSPIRCLSSLASGGDGSGAGGFSGGGGGGGGAGDGSEKVNEVLASGGGGSDLSALSPDVIILDVGGMTCGGCAASVKRILESQPQVSSASVNLATETAIVWPALEAKEVPNWQKELGEKLAKHLTTCGFQSIPRGQGDKEEEVA